MVTRRIYSRWRAYSWAALVISACVLNPFVAGAATPAAAVAKADEQKLALKVIETLVSAWNRNDMEAVAKLFLPDATLVTPKGEIIRSRSAIRKRIIDERQGRLKDTTLGHAIEDVSFPNGGTGITKGKYQLNGVKILGVNTAFEGSFVFYQIKQQGRWIISKAEILRKNSD